ncbi:MAG: sigma-54-dependent Fis family transcriptional regulator [Sandaracinaceae bacterium]|nr:sigma-54-dependent Fis family transcriptional regulator [Sandaracinaceae bacterium]
MLHEVALATRDPRLVHDAPILAAELGLDLTILADATEVRHRRLAERGALVLDPRAPDLIEAAGRAEPVADVAQLAVCALDSEARASRLAPREDLRRALELARGLAPARPRDAADDILGVSAYAAQQREQVRSVAAFSDVSVLVLGETGTGKELVARSIHELSAPERPFVAVNCAAIPEHLVESELFGHAAGAFTGAHGPRIGLMEAAEDGTLFLDEIGEMPRDPQSALLRAIEYRTFRRVGSNRDVPLRARVLAATNRFAREDRRRLRGDLYFRLAGVTILTAPLRARLVDVPVLVRRCLEDFARRHGGRGTVADDALARLARHPWPGNVRELGAVSAHAAILARGDTVRAAHVEAALESRIDVRSTPPPPSTPGARESGEHPILRPLPEMERELIRRALAECDGNVSRAARLLEVPRSTLRDKMERYGFR